MKKLMLGSVCFLSLVLCPGVYAMDQKTEKDSFLETVEEACLKGDFKTVKCLVEKVETPVYYLGENGFGIGHECWKKPGSCYEKECDAWECGVDDRLGEKYGEILWSGGSVVMFYDGAFECAVKKENDEIAEYLLSSEHTKNKISGCVKNKLILSGIECKNSKLVKYMWDFKKRGLIKYNDEVLEAVKRELTKWKKKK